MLFDAFKTWFEGDPREKIVRLLDAYRQELLTRFYTGSIDAEGFPILDASLDFKLSNLIRTKEAAFISFDNEWWATVPLDYVMFRCIQYDVVGPQIPWVRQRVGDADYFTLEILQSFFPQYGKKRHSKNKRLESAFQHLVCGNSASVIIHSQFKLAQRSPASILSAVLRRGAGVKQLLNRFKTIYVPNQSR